MVPSLQVTGSHRHASWLKPWPSAETSCRRPLSAKRPETTHSLAPDIRGCASADAGEDIEANRRIRTPGDRAWRRHRGPRDNAVDGGLRNEQGPFVRYNVGRSAARPIQ